MLLRLAALCLLLVACGSRPAVEPAPPAGPRVIVVSIDGLMPDVYRDPDAHGLKVPNLRAMAARGVVADGVVSVVPTSTYPAHTTIVTGVKPAVHGITTNRPPDGLGKNHEGWRWYAEDIKAPALWDVATEQGRRVALVTWPVTVGARVAYLVPEYWRAGTVDDQKLVRGLSTPGLLDAVEREFPALWEFLVPPDVKDDGPFAIARYIARNEPFDLMLVHAWAVDDAQHAHGAWSPEAIAAIEHADALIGGLLDVAGEGTTVVVLSDHGFAPAVTQVRLNALFVERGLITLDAEGKPTAARVTLAASGGSAYLYVDDASARDEIDAALASLGDVLAAVHGPGEIARLGGDPDAAYLLVAAPGYQFSEKRTGPIVSPSTGKGDHGHLPDDSRMHAAFVAVGPSLAPKSLGVIDMTEIAPMLAGWLGTTMPGVRAGVWDHARVPRDVAVR